MEIHFAISLLTVALLVSSSSTFQFKTGQCPEVKPMKDFEMYRVRMQSIGRQLVDLNCDL